MVVTYDIIPCCFHSYEIEFQAYQDDNSGQVTLKLDVDYYDSDRYRIVMMVNGDNTTEQRCPEDEDFELLVTRMYNCVTASTTEQIWGAINTSSYLK